MYIIVMAILPDYIILAWIPAITSNKIVNTRGSMTMWDCTDYVMYC